MRHNSRLPLISFIASLTSKPCGLKSSNTFYRNECIAIPTCDSLVMDTFQPALGCWEWLINSCALRDSVSIWKLSDIIDWDCVILWHEGRFGSHQICLASLYAVCYPFLSSLNGYNIISRLRLYLGKHRLLRLKRTMKVGSFCSGRSYRFLNRYIWVWVGHYAILCIRRTVGLCTLSRNFYVLQFVKPLASALEGQGSSCLHSCLA